MLPSVPQKKTVAPFPCVAAGAITVITVMSSDPVCRLSCTGVASTWYPANCTAGFPFIAPAASVGSTAVGASSMWYPLPDRSVHWLTLLLESATTPLSARYHACSPLATVGAGHGLRPC